MCNGAPAMRTSLVTALSLLSNVAVAQSAPPADAAAPQSFADRAGAFGVGVNLGNRVSGATVKLWASPRLAVQAAVGGGAAGNDLRGHADLVLSAAQWTSPDGQYLLPIYLGLGGLVGHTFASGAVPSDTAAGFRVPIGMSVLVRSNPVELFFEVAPEVTIGSRSSPHGRYVVAADGAIGFRYYL
jgi:hypothetical protein